LFSAFFSLIGATQENAVVANDADVVGKLLANNTVLETANKRFTGRSMFYIPKEPRRPAAPPAPRRTEPNPVVAVTPEPEPTIPTTYNGPGVTGVLGSEVFFDNGKRVATGNTAEGVKVLAVSGPFDVRLGWRGGEFDIYLFRSDMPDCFTTIPFADGTNSTLLQVETTARIETASQPEQNLREEIDRGPAGRDAFAGGAAAREVEVPDPLTDDDINALSRIDAVRARNKVQRAMRGDIDDQTRERLESEDARLLDRIRAPVEGGS
jgi:hypothetical protein